MCGICRRRERNSEEKMFTTKAQLLAQLQKLRKAASTPDPDLDKRLNELGFPTDGAAELELIGLIDQLRTKIKTDGTDWEKKGDSHV
jgi:hypothetical protein